MISGGKAFQIKGVANVKYLRWESATHVLDQQGRGQGEVSRNKFGEMHPSTPEDSSNKPWYITLIMMELQES